MTEPAIRSRENSIGSNASSTRLDAKEGHYISLRDVSYTVQVKKDGVPTDKKIVSDVTVCFNPGDCVALMGASGAGKTTLMDVVAGRKTIGTVGGEILIDGKARTIYFKRQSGYVEQFDTLLGTITCRDMILFTALLRMDQNIPRAAKEERTDQIIEQLGLSPCKDTMIGDRYHRGVSGGQCKRVNIGCSLVTNPGILFLDEPTSGLDSYTSLELAKSIRELANADRTIVCTIHQPSLDVFNQFNKLLLLSKGSVGYYGPVSSVATYMEKIGFPLPPNMNPADHIIEVTNPFRNVDTNFPKLFAESQEGKANRAHFDATVAHVEASVKDKRTDPESQYATSMPFSILVLLERYVRRYFRPINKEFFGTRVGKNVMMGLVIALVWFDLSLDQDGLKNRASVLFFCSTFLGMSAGIYVVPLMEERPLFIRERNDGLYRVSAYWIASLAIEIPFAIVSGVLYGCIVYWMVGLNDDPDRFAYFLLAVCLYNIACIGYAHMIAALVPSGELAQTVTVMSLGLFMIHSGFLLLRENMHPYTIWLHYTSFFAYGNIGLNINEFEGAEFSCEPMEPCVSSGDHHLEIYGFEDDDKWMCLLYLMIIFAGFRIVSFFALSKIQFENR